MPDGTPLVKVTLASAVSATVQLWLDAVLPTGLWLRVVALDRSAGNTPLHDPFLEAGGDDWVPLTSGPSVPAASSARAPVPRPSGRNRLLTARELAEAGVRRLDRADLPPGLLRYGVVCPGGWAATNLGTILFPDDYVLRQAPLLDCLPGSGTPSRHEERVWLSPLPSAPLRWAVEWPGEHIAETWTTVAWPERVHGA